MTWISTNVTNIYLASISFGTLQYLCNTLYSSQHIPTILGILPTIFGTLAQIIDLPHFVCLWITGILCICFFMRKLSPCHFSLSVLWSWVLECWQTPLWFCEFDLIAVFWLKSEGQVREAIVLRVYFYALGSCMVHDFKHCM